MNTDERRWKVFAVLIAICLICSGCGDPCGYTAASTLTSPSGKLRAVVFVRDCGATVRDDTVISLLRMDEKSPRRSANALTISDDRAHPIERSEPGVEVRMSWLANDRLKISFPAAATVRQRKSNVQGVLIEYGSF
jgi:hypothetical protein